MNLDTDRCRANANWSRLGKSIYLLPHFVYRVPIMIGTRCYEHLGTVKKRSDGRWDWYRMKSEFHGDWGGEGQGVELSQGAAELRILEGWSDVV